MNRFIFSLMLAASASAVMAQGSPDEERARIGAERARAEALFKEQEKACYGKFAVNDCVDKARVARRETLADLRRQEVSLNDSQRKRKGADRIRSIEERSSPEKQEQAAQDRAKSVEAAKNREERAAQKAADKAATAHPAKPHTPATPKKAPVADAEAARKYNERLKQAQERRERIAKRQQEQKQSPANALPVPP